MYDHLYEELVNNRLPPGSALSELEIAKKLQTSRSPVREAMMVLEGEGMVRRYPGRGCFVAEITVQDINEIFALRALLEVEALRNSYELITPQQLETVEKELLELTANDKEDAYYHTDRHLHEIIVNNCGNLRLVLILRTLEGQIEQLRRISASEPRRLSASRREHLHIVAALREHDLERACQLLAAHINNVKTATLNVSRMMELNSTRAAR